jgi:hypothetical protein
MKSAVKQVGVELDISTVLVAVSTNNVPVSGHVLPWCTQLPGQGKPER